MELQIVMEHKLAVAMKLIDQAKAFLKRQGVGQWQKEYPDRNCIAADIEKIAFEKRI